MRTRKEMKKAAKHVLKTHYVLLVFTCLFVAFVGTEFSNSLVFMNESTSFTKEDENGIKTQTAVSELKTVDVLRDMLQSKDAEVGKKEATSLEEQMKNGTNNAALGHTRGVLASAVNALTSGSVFVTIFAGINSVFRSQNAAVVVFVILSMVLMIAMWFLFKNILSAIARRIFLESRTYEKVPASKFIFFFRVKKWLQVSWIMFVKYLYQALWNCTIVGGIIKHYSYAMVPYIVAENPTLHAREVITLSRKMMDGYKWKCFIVDLSFLGWQIVGTLTGGLANIFFVDPYIIATYSEIYAELRKQAIKQKTPGYEAMNDIYLFEKPDEDTVKSVYSDVIKLMNEPMEEVSVGNKVLNFIADVFGLIPVYGVREKAYERNEGKKAQIDRYKDIVDGKRYPNRLFIIPEKEKRQKEDQMRYLRRYSIWSVILLFFSFSLIGWIWEVSLHLVSDGQFVNRGVLHGPWLPIYGTGAVLILLVLNKFRENATVEFITAIVLCGCVEYFTSYFLEKTQGQKWWDYSGYFLNLNGRICAEGLLVFGVGGMAIVYVCAPLLDNLFRKMKLQVMIPICLVLLCVFICDQTYSNKHPNTGKGITDYQSRQILDSGNIKI